MATSRDSRGWYAEFRIPFSTLRYAQGGPQRWGVNASRTIRRRNEEVFWAPIPRQFDLYRVSMAGTLAGFEAPNRRAAQVTPFVLGSGQKDYVAGTDTDTNVDVGGDVKVGLTPSLALDLTLNTDFAQVEVDDEQVNLTRFPLFFPEKRPFFLENAGTFSVGTARSVELFFSRRIGIAAGSAVPITAGGRVTGKVAGLTVGLLNLQTQRTSGFDDAGLPVQLAPPNNFGAVRLLKDFRNRTRLGGTFVSRLNTRSTGDYNLTYGVDGRLGIGTFLTFDGYAAFTQTPGIESGEHAYSASVSYDSRGWDLSGDFRKVGAGFNPEVGFLERRSYRMVMARILRRFRPDTPWMREIRPHISYREFFDLDGFSETRLIHIDSHWEFENGAFFQLPAINFTREGLKEPFEISEGIVVPPGAYHNFDWGFRYNTDRSATLSLEGRIDLGGFYSGTRYGAETTVNTRVGDTFVASLRVAYFDVNLAEGNFETAVVGLRAAYSFTPRIYLQSLLQYSDVSDSFSSNIRLGWLNTAGTGLFLVYNDIEATDAITGRGLEPLDRTFIVKFTRQLEFSR